MHDGVKNEEFSAVDYGNRCEKETSVFKLPSGSVITLELENDPDWKLVLEESGFNEIINVPHLIGVYPSSYYTRIIWYNI